jgi:hypothetical protein
MRSLCVQSPLLCISNASKCINGRFTCSSSAPDRPSFLGLISSTVVQQCWQGLTIDLFTVHSIPCRLSLAESTTHHGASAIAPDAFFQRPCWRLRIEPPKSGRISYTPPFSRPGSAVYNLARIVCIKFSYQTRDRHSHKPARFVKSNVPRGTGTYAVD